MEIYVELHAAFATALATSDVSCIQQFFSQPDMVAQLARVEASITGVSVDAENPPNPWHLGPHLKLALQGTIQNDQCEVLEWLFAAGRGDTMGVVLASFLPELVKMAIEYRRIGILAVMLDSSVFVDKIADDAKLKLLDQWVGTSVQHHEVEIINVLVGYGACVNSTQHEIRSALFYAKVETVDALSSHGMFFVGADVPLTGIMRRRGDEVLKALIGHGVAMDAAHLGETLRFAAEGPLVELVKRLLKHTYFDVDFVTGNQQSALMVVAWQRYRNDIAYRDQLAEITTLLLEYGADVNLQDAWGSTPLHFACRSDVPEIVGILLNNGADHQVRTNFGQRPQDEIYANNIEDENISAIMALLLEHGADLHATTEKGDSMFHELSESNAGKAFLEAHADVIRANTLKRPRK